jgi:Zn-dependent membrane protease YugP
MDLLLDYLRRLIHHQVPDSHYIYAGVGLTLFVILWSEMWSKSAIGFLIWLFRLPGRHGPEGRELAPSLLGAEGASGVAVDETALDTGFRLTFGQMDYQPERNVLELTEDKAKEANLASAGLVVLEVGRALQHLGRFPLVQVQRTISGLVNFAGFAWFWPSLGATVLPLLFPQVVTPMVVSWLYKLSAFLLLTLAFYVLLKIPLDLDAARRGVSAMKRAGAFSPGEAFGIRLFLALLLTLTVFTALLMALNIFRTTVRKD